uniref:C-type lectin domain family 10 member A-like n=1 Tax=Crassostrea virginica TaxID=6565 RepID=A0A8B8BQ74_CRAVI|nr:C-type lectin domain family 10 member A-like [Crassostrea virginica]
MQYFSVCTFCVLCTFVVMSKSLNATQQEEEGVLMKNISDLHFQLFSSIQKKTKMIKTAVFETQCSGSGCTFNGCESSGSDTCDRQMIVKLNNIQSSINNIWKKKPKAIGCKDGWKPYNDHCYYSSSTKMNWFEAQVFCRKQGTSLLQINSADENNWISKNFKNVQFWIDYTDIGMEGKWVSLFSGKSDYAIWLKGQPDNGNNLEHCAYMHNAGGWNDQRCLIFKCHAMCEASGSDF